MDPSDPRELRRHGQRKDMGVKGPSARLTDKLDGMRQARSGRRHHDRDRYLVIGVVVADRVGEEGQRDEAAPRPRSQRLQGQWQCRAQAIDRRRHQQLHAARAIVEIRRPDGADARLHLLFRDAPEPIDIAGGGIARDLVEIGVRPEAVIITALGNQHILARKFDFEGLTRHRHLLFIRLDHG